MQLYIQHQICYRAKNPSLMNHHFCLLIPSDWLKVRPWRQHQHQSSLQCVRVFSNVVMTDWYMRIRISICTLEWMMNLYSALCIVVHPKRFTIMLGGLSSTTTKLGLFVNQLAFTIHVWKLPNWPQTSPNFVHPPKPIFPCTIKYKTAQSGNTVCKAHFLWSNQFLVNKI